MEGKNYAIIVAAGKGERMGANISKQFIMLVDKPIIVHTMLAFERHPLIEAVVLVVASCDINYVQKDIVGRYSFQKPIIIIEGGVERQHSVYNGLRVLPEDAEIVVIHDGVRPLVTGEMIETGIHAAGMYGAAVIGMPMKDTVKKVDAQHFVLHTPEREMLWMVQTPQAFRYKLIKEAHERALKDGFLGTDDGMLVERLGYSVKMVEGSYHNIKITTQEDLVLAGELIKRRMNLAHPNIWDME